MTESILAPVVALILWSLIIWLWMYATRLPAMSRAKVKLDPAIPPGQLLIGLPPRVRWKADNYNHLMEQPTLFYATALAIAVAGGGADTVSIALAWSYVGLRVAHSLVQTTVNVIVVRFGLFVLATLALCGLAVQAALLVF